MRAAARAAQAPGGLRAEVVRDAAGLLRLRAAWSALCGEARSGCLFLSPEWLIPWWEHFGPGREPSCVAIFERDRLVGFLPLFSEPARLAGVPARRVAFLGDGATGCDYLDVLAAPGREAEVRAAALEMLGELPWDVCDLDGLWRDSPTARHLAQLFPNGRAVRSSSAGLGGAPADVVRDARLRFVCPHIPLAGSYQDYLETLGRRENLRRREKWLFRQPGVSVEVARSAEEARVAVERFLELHRARWAVEGGSDGLADPRHDAFHRDAVEQLAERGWLRMYTLFAARRPVASVYGVVHGGKFLYYQSGYDPAWASKSVGLVLLARTLQDAYGEGLREFDFLRGDEAYKAQWARGERWTIQMRLFRSARGKAVRAAVRAALFARESVKAALPRAALEKARRARRLFWGTRLERMGRIERCCAPSAVNEVALRSGLAGRRWRRGRMNRLKEQAVQLARRAVKGAAALALHYTGARDLISAVQRRAVGGVRVLIVSYHRVVGNCRLESERGLPTLNIGRDTFRRHLEVLCESHQITRLDDALEVLGGRRRARRDLAVITFDDGYRDVYENAFPVLREMKLPAVAYVPSSFIGTPKRLAHDRLWGALMTMERRALGPMSVGVGGEYEGLLLRAFERAETPNKVLERLISDNPTPVLYGLAEALEDRLRIDRAEAPRGQLPMTWEMLREMGAHGIETGAHTAEHTVLTNQPLDEARREIAVCKGALEKGTARPVRHFAYCNGWYSAGVAQALRAEGFVSAVTTEDMPNMPGVDPYALKRKVLWEISSAGILGGWSKALAACQLNDTFGMLALQKPVLGARPTHFGSSHPTDSLQSAHG